MLKNMKFFNKKIKPYLSSFRAIFLDLISLQKGILSYFKYSFSERNPEEDDAKLKYYLMKHCHIIEKGLALPDPRVGFGQDKISNLIIKTREYEKNKKDNVGFIIRDTLRAYMLMHRGHKDVFAESFWETMECFVDESENNNFGGLLEVKRSDLNKWSLHDFEDFLLCRHSVRNFTDEPVDLNLLARVMNASLRTPSVCNRQGWFFHVYSDKQEMNSILALQNGNAGFTGCIDKLLIVTCDLKAFTRFEHNQLYIDGGLVSMNLLLAIHAAGLGACPLNTCMPSHKEEVLLRIAGIPKNQKMIMMIAVGNINNVVNVAKSKRFLLSDVAIFH